MWELTTVLNNGWTVLGKIYKGELCAKTYANRTQAQQVACKLGPVWEVARTISSRVYYVRKMAHFCNPI